MDKNKNELETLKNSLHLFLLLHIVLVVPIDVVLHCVRDTLTEKRFFRVYCFYFHLTIEVSQYNTIKIKPIFY